MNTLEALKDKLKHKPEVQPNEGVRVVIKPMIGDVTKPIVNPIISANKDNGTQAIDILEKIKKKQLSLVMNRLPKIDKEEEINRAPVIAPIVKKDTLKKIDKKVTLIEDAGVPVMKEDAMDDNAMDEYKDAMDEYKDKDVIDKTGLQDIEGVDIEEVIKGNTVKKKRTTSKAPKGVIELGPENMILIGDTPLAKRLPRPPIFKMKVSNFYMNNREIFVNFINSLFEPYKDDLLDESKGISCEDIGKDSGTIGLLTHQKIVRDYMNLYTPYRGLLLYHGLGSGKTCSSIAIAEGMKSARKVIIMTPASLRRNYMEEIKKCGDLLYRKNQYWEWISIDNNTSLTDSLSGALGLPQEYIRRNHGAWLVNIMKPSNYTELSSNDKKVLNDQLDEMIQNKYTFINYNGLRKDKFGQLTNNFEKNIFDNSIVIIDEAHNLISRIVNKISKIKKFATKARGPGATLPQFLSLILYEFLLNADNCRVVLLTGTPIINYPNEIGILFNILRGYIKTWNLALTVDTNKKLSKDTLMEIFAREKTLDYVDFVPSSKTLTITRNPFGFDNKITASGYKGVTNERKESIDEATGRIMYDERGKISDSDFIQRIVKLLKKYDITAIPTGTTYNVNTALPDTLDEFVNHFINKDTGNMTNIDKFKRRIIGLTSYFRSAQEELLPSYDKNYDKHEVYIPMSDYQFNIYETYRQVERKMEKPKKNQMIGDDLYAEASSTYRIFSRLACNFVMPTPPGRPMPSLYHDDIEHTELFKEMKKRYFPDDDTFDDDIKYKIDTFKTIVGDKKWNENQVVIIEYINRYVKDYINNGVRDSIQDYFIKNGQNVIATNEAIVTIKPTDDVKPTDDAVTSNPVAKPKTKLSTATVTGLARATSTGLKALDKQKKEEEKALTKQKKEEEKQRKEEEKALEKQRKEEEKALAKQKKEEEKALEKQRKEEEKALAKQKKEEEKALEKQRKEEEKQRKKAMKGGEIGDDNVDDNESIIDDNESVSDKDNVDDNVDDNESITDDNESITDNDNDNDLEYIGGSSPAETFINNNVEESIQIDGYKDEDANLRDAEELEGDELLDQMGDMVYKKAISAALTYLKAHASECLSNEGLKTYGPKYLAMLENIEDEEHKGLHLIYSQFRSMEGIGIFCMVLETNGFAKFKIKRNANGWEIDMSEEDMGKPCYALYTGTENAEEREILRNIYNGTWDYIPNNIANQLRAKSSNNNLGEIIKVLMITSAGSEGINLRNTRYVHIMEPYWNPVRVEQVIGRARRICSHQGLPKELQTVEVFIYIMTFTKQQLDSDFAIELKLKDLSKTAPYVPQSSDQKLYEISNIKEQVAGQLLKAVKESSIDCATHSKSSSKEGLVCLSFGQPSVTDFAYNPNYAQDENDTVANLNKEEINWEARPFTFKETGKRYMLRMDTKQVYDYDSVIRAKEIPGVRPILIGKLIKNANGNYEIVKDKI